MRERPGLVVNCHNKPEVFHGAHNRYSILDLPHSVLIQSNYLRSIGFTKLLMYDEEMGDLNSILERADYEVLFMLPRHLKAVNSDTFDLVCNFDSLVEMPADVIKAYVSDIGRVSHAFYSVNVNYGAWRSLQAELDQLKPKFSRTPTQLQPQLHGFGDQVPWTIGVMARSTSRLQYHEQLLIDLSWTGTGGVDSKAAGRRNKERETRTQTQTTVD